MSPRTWDSPGPGTPPVLDTPVPVTPVLDTPDPGHPHPGHPGPGHPRPGHPKPGTPPVPVTPIPVTLDLGHPGPGHLQSWTPPSRSPWSWTSQTWIPYPGPRTPRSQSSQTWTPRSQSARTRDTPVPDAPSPSWEPQHKDTATLRVDAQHLFIPSTEIPGCSRSCSLPARLTPAAPKRVGGKLGSGWEVSSERPGTGWSPPGEPLPRQ